MERGRRLSRDLHPGLRLRAPEPHHRRGSESAGCRLVPCEFSQWLMEFKRPTAETVLCVGRVCGVIGRTVLWAAVSVALAGMATGLSAKVGSCFHHNPGNDQDEEMVWGAECVVSVYMGGRSAPWDWLLIPLPHQG